MQLAEDWKNRKFELTFKPINMRATHLILLLVMAIATSTYAQDSSTGIFNTAVDVGDPAKKGILSL
jgi:hypothetical protein